jgi:tRNA pseudouridine55 synthase
MGTLDPEAAGVLPLAVGRATRLIPFVEGTTKTYRAQVVFGVATDTYDIHGTITARNRVEHLDLHNLKEALAGFHGDVLQVPPMYSALKVQGRKLYELAREGVEVERRARPVSVHRLDVCTVGRDSDTFWALLHVECSKGTYVRSLCHDLGQALGIPACMGFLLRLASGPFAVRDSRTLDEVERDAELIPIDTPFSPDQRLLLDGGRGRRFVQGQQQSSDQRDGIFAVLCGNVFLGMGRVDQAVLRPLKVLAREGEVEC